MWLVAWLVPAYGGDDLDGADVTAIGAYLSASGECFKRTDRDQRLNCYDAAVIALGQQTGKITEAQASALIALRRGGAPPPASTASSAVVARFEGVAGSTMKGPFSVDGPWDLRFYTSAPTGITIFVNDAATNTNETMVMQGERGSGSSIVARGGTFYVQVFSAGDWWVEAHAQ
jgi:hypothetical protein